MFSWIRDKTATSYNPIQNDQSSTGFNSRPQTTSSMSHQQQHSNGREFFNDLDRNVC
jgi:cyclophilin family peptidyl-prolyl cis-trans isomerase